MSSRYPQWTCNNCGKVFPEDTKHVKCPGEGKKCGGKLVRWERYEVKTK